MNRLQARLALLQLHLAIRVLGVSDLARLIGEPITTVHGWWRRQAVPRWRHAQVEAAAEQAWADYNL